MAGCMRFFEILSAVLYVLGWLGVLSLEDRDLSWSFDDMVTVLLCPMIIIIFLCMQVADKVKTARRVKKREAEKKADLNERLLEELVQYRLQRERDKTRA